MTWEVKFPAGEKRHLRGCFTEPNLRFTHEIKHNNNNGFYVFQQELVKAGHNVHRSSGLAYYADSHVLIGYKGLNSELPGTHLKIEGSNFGLVANADFERFAPKRLASYYGYPYPTVEDPFMYEVPDQWHGSDSGVLLIKSLGEGWGGAKAPSGEYYVGLQRQGSFLSQRLNVIVGHTFTINFAAGSRPGHGTNEKLVVKIDNIVMLELSTLPEYGFRRYSFSFISTNVYDYKFISKRQVSTCDIT